MTTTDSDPHRHLEQWTASDLAEAREAGDHARISAALDSGRLREVLNQKKPEPRRTTPRLSAPISNSDRDLERARQTIATFTDERNQA